MKVWKILAWTGVAVVTAASIMWVKNQLALLMSMTYKFKDFKLDPSASGGNVKLNFNLELKNPSQVTITAYEYDLQVYVNDSLLVATIRNDGAWQAEIPAGASSLIPLSVEFSPKALGQNVIHLAVNSLLTAKMAVTVKGTMSMRVGKSSGISVRKTLPVNFTQNVIGKDNG